MSSFASFAAAGGSGRLGSAIVAGLQTNGAAKVVVLSRSTEAQVPSGAEIRAVDYTSIESFTLALKEVDVLVSTVWGPGGHEGSRLAEAAKAAGVKLYVPNEFGASTAHVSLDSPLGYKVALRSQCDQLGLASLTITVGLFPETTFGLPYARLHLPTEKVTVIGSLETPYSFTRPTDVGSFVGALLTKRSAEELLALGSVAIEGDRASLREVVDTYERSHPGKKIQVEQASIEDAEKELAGLEGMAHMIRWLTLDWAKGSADSTQGGKVELANELVPEWKPSKVGDYLATLE